jgi:hypothetical protein
MTLASATCCFRVAITKTIARARIAVRLPVHYGPLVLAPARTVWTSAIAAFKWAKASEEDMAKGDGLRRAYQAEIARMEGAQRYALGKLGNRTSRTMDPKDPKIFQVRLWEKHLAEIDRGLDELKGLLAALD